MLEHTKLKKSIEGINRMIAERKEELRLMANFLESPLISQKKYSFATVYRRGPKVVDEIDRLVLIRLDLTRLARKSVLSLFA